MKEEVDPPRAAWASGTGEERRRYYNPVEKGHATFLQTSEETGGERTLMEVEVAPGGGTEPHYHKTYDEHFEVVEGVLEVLVGKETRTLRAGQKAVAERNALHRFRNPTGEPATFLVELRPGHAGFEKAVGVVYGLASDNRVFSDGTPKNPYHLALILEWSEIQIPGVMGKLGLLFRLLARRARRKGIDKRLEAEYRR